MTDTMAPSSDNRVSQLMDALTLYCAIAVFLSSVGSVKPEAARPTATGKELLLMVSSATANERQ